MKKKSNRDQSPYLILYLVDEKESKKVILFGGKIINKRSVPPSYQNIVKVGESCENIIEIISGFFADTTIGRVRHVKIAYYIMKYSEYFE